MAHEIREILLDFPVVTQVVSQMGRPDDGTDVTTFNNIEFMVTEESRAVAAAALTKEKLIGQMDAELEKYPGRRFQFLAEHSGQRRGGHVRREGRELAQAFRRRH